MCIAPFNSHVIMPFHRKHSETQWDELTGRCLQRGSLKSKPSETFPYSSCNPNKLYLNGAANRCRAAWAAPAPELIPQSRVLGAVRTSAACFHLRGLIQNVCASSGMCGEAEVCAAVLVVLPRTGRRRGGARIRSDRWWFRRGIFGLSESVMTTSVCVFPSKLKRCN